MRAETCVSNGGIARYWIVSPTQLDEALFQRKRQMAWDGNGAVAGATVRKRRLGQQHDAGVGKCSRSSPGSEGRTPGKGTS